MKLSTPFKNKAILFVLIISSCGVEFHMQTDLSDENSIGIRHTGPFNSVGTVSFYSFILPLHVNQHSANYCGFDHAQMP